MVERKMEKSMEEMDLEYIANSDLEWSKYKNKTIFVTGATGLIGSLLVKAFAYYNCLHQGNIKIIGLIRNEEKAKRIYGKWYNNYGIHLMIGDIEQIPVIAGDVDYIFHTVSITASKMMVQHPVLTIQTSYMGTKNVLDLAVDKKIEGMVYVSSMEVYGIPDEKKEYITEKDLGYIELENVRSSYSEGKRICECLCNAYTAEFGLPVKSARLAQTFGAGVLQEDNRVYAQFARSAMKKENLVLRTDGSSEGNYCYTRDVIRALLLLGYSGKVGEAYNVVNEYSYEELVRVIRDYGEEKYATSIAKNIVKDRESKPIETTFELVDIIKKSMPYKAMKDSHPARRTFQAIRIEVNNELEVLKIALKSSIELLKVGGRVSVITFHSLEDRIVKEIFNEYSKVDSNLSKLPFIPEEYMPKYKVVASITPSREELEENPRARSSRLRVIEKIKD
mgnify:CR=1 FL=1